MHTDLNNIEKLVEKYLNAETDLQEEALLKNYFNSNTVAPHLQEYQYMFQYFTRSKSDRYTKSIRLEPSIKKRKWLGIAVSLLMVLGLLSYNKYRQYQINKAYKDTKMALQIIANQMNKGTVAIAELNTINKTTRKVFKQQKK